MHIKLKKNKSGSTSVQVVESIRIVGSKYPRPRLLKSFGSALTNAEIEILKLKAQAYLDSLPDVQFKSSTIGELIIRAESDITSCTSTITGFKDVFNKLYNDIFHSTTLKNKGNDMLSQLAIMRIIEPKSKNYTANIASHFGYDLKVDNIYKLMDRIDDEVIAKIQACSYRNTKRLLAEKEQKLDVLFYDLTSIYFETNAQDELRDFGFSKDGKSQHVQIMLAMIVTHHGLPIAYETFQGNTYEGVTLIPTLESLRKKYKISRVILVADSGLINKDNVDKIAETGLEYVIGARLKNSTKTIIEEALKDEGYTTITDNTKGKTYTLLNKKKQPTGHKLMLYYSEARARKDLHDRNRAVTKISKHIGEKAKNKLSGALRKSYVTLSEESSTIGIDQEKLKEAAKFDGYFSIQTNIVDAKPADILAHYSGLWQIEQTFRITKHNLKIRPVFHYNTARIKAHFAICYIALTLVRTLELMMKRAKCYIPIEQLVELLQKVMIITITSNGQRYDIAKDFPPELIEIYKCVKAKVPNRFISW
jgi:transposase